MHDTHSFGKTVAASQVPTPVLIKNIGRDLKSLADLEVKLAQAEAKADLHAELYSAKFGAVAAVCALLALNLFAVALALLFDPEHAWAVAAIEALLFLAVAGFCGFKAYKSAHKDPLGHTRETLKEDLEWIRGQIR